MYIISILRGIWVAIQAAFESRDVAEEDDQWRTSSRVLEDSARLIFNSLIDSAAASAIAEAAQGDGYLFDSESVYRLYLTSDRTNLRFLDRISAKHRADLALYWDAVESLKRRAVQPRASSVVQPQATTPASSPAPPPTITSVIQPPAPSVPSATSSVPLSTISTTSSVFIDTSIGSIFPVLPTSPLFSSTSLLFSSPTTEVSSTTASMTPVSHSASITSISHSASIASISPSAKAPPLSATTASGGLSRGAKIGIGVAVPVVVILAAGIAICFWFGRRGKHGQSHPDDGVLAELGPGAQEAMSRKAASRLRPNIPEMSGVGAGVPMPVGRYVPPNDAPPAQLDTNVPPNRQSAFKFAPPPLDPLIQHPHDTFKEVTAAHKPEAPLSSQAIPRKPTPAHADPTGLHIVETTDSPGNREEQIRELEMRRQAIAQRMARVSELQRLEDEKRAIEEMIGKLREGG